MAKISVLRKSSYSKNTKRHATQYAGVYERRAERVKGIVDTCFDISYRDGNKRKVWEKVGWKSQGYTAVLANQIRNNRIYEIQHGKELPKEKEKAPLFSEVAEKYLAWSKQNKNRAGIEDKSRYENHVKERLETKRMDEISPFDLEKMKAEMAKDKIAPKSIAHCLGLIRAMFNKAADWNLYEGPNPVKKIKMPVVQNARDRFLSYDEAEILLKELKHNIRYKEEYKELEDPKLHDISLLSLHTGARAAEIFNLKSGDTDFKNGFIALRDTKNTETRYAPITKALQTMLKRRISKDPSEFIFKDSNGGKIKEVSNAFEKVVDRLGLNKGVTDPRQKMVFHTLRHTFASWLAIQGTPLYTIAKLMGHKSIAMSERYSHLSPDHKKDAVSALEKSFEQRKKQAKGNTT